MAPKKSKQLTTEAWLSALHDAQQNIEDAMTTAEMADRLGVATSTVLNWMKRAVKKGKIKVTLTRKQIISFSGQPASAPAYRIEVLK